MANYNCTIRTNYFHVKDEESFEKLMARVYCEDNIDLWKEKDKNNNAVYGFGCYGGISGLINATEDEEGDCDETSYDEFLDELQKLIAEDDAIIILEAGEEKLRYVVGSATIITCKEIKYINITTLAIHTAAQMLGNENFTTECSY